jgi:hypothetical protein
MGTEAWQIIGWPKFKCTMQHWETIRGILEPISHSVNYAQSEDRTRGQVLWATHIDSAPIGMGWDWASNNNQVLVLADPMAVLSNVQLVTERGEPVDEGYRLLCLNDAVRALPWQEKLHQQRFGASELETRRLLAA